MAGDANVQRYVGNEVTGATDPSGLALPYPLTKDRLEELALAAGIIRPGDDYRTHTIEERSVTL